MATLTPYLCVHDGAAALSFYRNAFDAEESGRHFIDSAGRVGHAEFRIQGVLFMLSDESPDSGVLSPQTLGGPGVSLYLDCPNVDAMVESGVRAGATLDRAVANTPYGTRSGTIIDPFGHRWIISTQVQNFGADDLYRLANEYRNE